MKPAALFTTHRDEVIDSDLNFNSFRTPSPGSGYLNNDYFPGNELFNFDGFSPIDAKEGIESLFTNKPHQSDRDNFNCDFGASEKFLFNNDQNEGINFIFNNDFANDSFKKPFGKRTSGKSIRDQETVCNTKESYSTVAKKESCKSVSTETKSDCYSMNQRKFFMDELASFKDLCPMKETDMPDLNSLVSLSIDQGSSSLSVKLCTCELKNCKLLNNFLDMAGEEELLDMKKLLNECKSELVAKLDKLSGQAY